MTIKYSLRFSHVLGESRLGHGPQSQGGISGCSGQHVWVEWGELHVLKGSGVTFVLWRVHGNSALLIMQFNGEWTTTTFPWNLNKNEQN